MGAGDAVTAEREFEEAVREVFVEMVRRDYEGPDLRLADVTLEREYPWTRLVVYFRRDDAPGRLFGYWGSIWEEMAWYELHEPAMKLRSRPGGYFASDFVFGMETDLSNADLPDGVDEASDPGEPWAPEGVRWIRSRVRW